MECLDPWFAHNMYKNRLSEFTYYIEQCTIKIVTADRFSTTQLNLQPTTLIVNLENETVLAMQT